MRELLARQKLASLLGRDCSRMGLSRRSATCVAGSNFPLHQLQADQDGLAGEAELAEPIKVLME